jgi:hypothetical protein
VTQYGSVARWRLRRSARRCLRLHGEVQADRHGEVQADRHGEVQADRSAGVSWFAL